MRSGSVKITYPSGHGGGGGGSGVTGGLGNEGELGVEAGDDVAGVAGKDGVCGLGDAGELGVQTGGGEGGIIGVNGEEDDGGGGEPERGHSCKSPSSPSPHNSSTLQRHFVTYRVRLAGGGEAEGEIEITAGGGGGAAVVTGGGAGSVCRRAELFGALRVIQSANSRAMEPVMAVLRRRRRRRRCRFQAADAVREEIDGKREAVSMTSCPPAV